MTVRPDGNEFRSVTMTIPKGVSFSRSWHRFTALKYSFNLGDHADWSVGTPNTPTTTLCDVSPVYVVMMKVGCILEHAHCSTMYIS